LDKELDALKPENERKKRHADKLVKFFTKAGKAYYVLLHVEVQGYKGEHFAERMFEYYYRIRDRWKTEVCSFVIYTDEDTGFHPSQSEKDYYGTKTLYQFNTFDLSKKQKQDLDIPQNPFSTVMKVAHKFFQKQQLKDRKQFIWKMELIRDLFEAGYAREKTPHILDFIRLYVRFAKPEKEEQLEQAIEIFTKPPKPMGIREAVLAEMHRIGEAKGEVKGKKEDTFGMFAEGLSLDAIVRITKLPLSTIQEWQKEWTKNK